MDTETRKYFQQMNRIDMNREPLERIGLKF